MPNKASKELKQLLKDSDFRGKKKSTHDAVEKGYEKLEMHKDELPSSVVKDPVSQKKRGT